MHRHQVAEKPAHAHTNSHLAMQADRTARCPKPGEIERLFEERDRMIANLQAKGAIDAKDLHDLERSGKCIVANEHWNLCTKDARDALHNDGHHFVRSCAAIAASKGVHRF